MVDLTGSDSANETEQEAEHLPQEGIKKENLKERQLSNKQDFNLQKSFSEDTGVFVPQLDCGNLKPKLICLNSETQHQKQTSESHGSHHTPAVKLKRLPFLESHFRDLETSRCSVYLTKDCTQLSLCLGQVNNNSEAPEHINNLRMTTSPPLLTSPRQNQEENSNQFTNMHLQDISLHLQSQACSPHSDNEGSIATLKERSTCQDKTDDFFSSVFTPSPTSSQHKAQGFIQREILSSNTEELEADKARSRQSISDLSTPNSPNPRPYTCVPLDPKSLSPSSPVSLNHNSPVDPTSTSGHAPVENIDDWQLEKSKADGTSISLEFLSCSTLSDPPLSGYKAEDMDEGSGTGTYRDDLGMDSPVSFLWEEGSDGEGVNEDSQYEMNFRAASTEDRNFVCPVTLKKMMSGSTQALVRNFHPNLYLCF